MKAAPWAPHSKVGLDQRAVSAVEMAIVRSRAGESGAVGAALQSGPRPVGGVGGGDGDCALEGG